MGAVKLVVWSRPNKDGQYPIAVKISKNGQTPSYIFTEHALSERSLWDSKAQQVTKAHPNYKRLNNLLLKKLTEATDTTLEMEANKTDSSTRAIKKKIKPVCGATFNEIADIYLKDQLALGQYNIYNADKPRIERFIEFAKNKNMPFSEITVGLLEKYQRYLRTCKNKNQKKSDEPKFISERTVVNHLLLMRTLYNRAIKAGAADVKNYPFGEEGKISIKFPKSSKIGLIDQEIASLENLDLSANPILNHARNIWLTAYYFAGMRITDVLLLKWSDIKNDRLFYTMSKNNEPCSLKIPQKVHPILEQYKTDEPRHDLIFPELKFLDTLNDIYLLQKRISHCVNYQNTKMKKIFAMLDIKKKSSTHVTRHSFAQRAEELGIHPRVVQELYRHESIQTTMIYQSNFSKKKTDEALDLVVG
ncbi:Site-specific recombinase XerD [Pedobacter suwonensis]|uniref:Site-specific recombinase XerD n=1 Tax=Pedobacter suwonensis TaxID=332999 RepID=A0A1I0TVF4_9SPHI|nr:site-specific integrase [Pedobacter suwonensis]SFA54916.1 Site-specific recombinase XerD [Pedobacter suwonensis]